MPSRLTLTARPSFQWAGNKERWRRSPGISRFCRISRCRNSDPPVPAYKSFRNPYRVQLVTQTPNPVCAARPWVLEDNRFAATIPGPPSAVRVGHPAPRTNHQPTALCQFHSCLAVHVQRCARASGGITVRSGSNTGLRRSRHNEGARAFRQVGSHRLRLSSERCARSGRR